MQNGELPGMDAQRMVASVGNSSPLTILVIPRAVASRDGFHTRTMAIGHAVEQRARPPRRRTRNRWTGRAERAQGRLGVDVRPGGFENRLPGTNGRPPAPGTTAPQMFAQNAGRHDFADGQPEDQDQDGHGQGLEGLLAPQGQHRAQTAAESTVASVTAIARAICPYDTPPSSAASRNTGSAAASITSTFNRLASSLPNTNSRLTDWSAVAGPACGGPFRGPLRWPPADAEKKTARASCSGARI